MYYDLNVPYTSNTVELQRTLAFLAERESTKLRSKALAKEVTVGYDTLALNHTITGIVPTDVKSQIPKKLPFGIPNKLNILRRCTLQHSDPSQNYRLSSLSSVYDVLALRPTTEKALQQACHSLECDLISLDFSIRYPFYFQMKTVKSAIDRGIKFEICYGPGIMNADGGASRRNLISNATQLIRATRGRGIIISSEAKTALACRSPADVMNLAAMWGLQQERGAEAVGREARSVVVQAEMKRHSFRGVIDVVCGGDDNPRPEGLDNPVQTQQKKAKRKADVLDNDVAMAEASSKAISKREQKRQAKKARQGVEKTDVPVDKRMGTDNDLPPPLFNGDPG